MIFGMANRKKPHLHASDISLTCLEKYILLNIISLFYLEIEVFLSSIPQNLLWIPTENLTGIPLGSDGIPLG